MPNTPDPTVYDESEREAYAFLAEILNGEIIDLAGGMAGIRYGDHFDQPHTPENEGDPADGWNVAAIDLDGGPWMVTYEHKGDTGQRGWVDVALPTHWRAFPQQVQDAFRLAGHAAAQGVQL